VTRWAIRQTRRGLYAPINLCAWLGVVPPFWLVAVTVAMDEPLRRELSRQWEAERGL
jgi:hypothetical protein